MMKKIIIFGTVLLTIFACAGCTLAGLPGQPADDVKKVPIIEIDEREIELIENIDEQLETSYQTEVEMVDTDAVRDPFKPYYITEEEEKENVLLLETIYSEQGQWYAEIRFNEFLYKLAQGDVFANIYMLEAVHENSVVLLKGDEIITLSLGQLLYD